MGKWATLADKFTDTVGILTIGWMATQGITAYEPIAAIASIALGTRYIKHKMNSAATDAE